MKTTRTYQMEGIVKTTRTLIGYFALAIFVGQQPAYAGPLAWLSKRGLRNPQRTPGATLHKLQGIGESRIGSTQGPLSGAMLHNLHQIISASDANSSDSFIENYRALTLTHSFASLPPSAQQAIRQAIDHIEKFADGVRGVAHQDSDAVREYANAARAYERLAEATAHDPAQSQKHAQKARDSYLDAAEVFARAGKLRDNHDLIEKAEKVATTHGISVETHRVTAIENIGGSRTWPTHGPLSNAMRHNLHQITSSARYLESASGVYSSSLGANSYSFIENYRALTSTHSFATLPPSAQQAIRKAIDYIEKYADAVRGLAHQNSDPVEEYAKAARAYERLAEATAHDPAQSQKHAQKARDSYLDAAEVFARAGKLRDNHDLIEKAEKVATTHGISVETHRITAIENIGSRTSHAQR